jgi:hypothetical protein
MRGVSACESKRERVCVYSVSVDNFALFWCRAVSLFTPLHDLPSSSVKLFEMIPLEFQQEGDSSLLSKRERFARFLKRREQAAISEFKVCSM